MIHGTAGEVKDKLFVVRGLEDPNHDIIHVKRYGEDFVVMLRSPGKTGWYAVGEQGYYPTTYGIYRLAPIDPSKYPTNKMILYREMKKERRKDFTGWFRMDEMYVHFTPGRKRSIVKTFIKAIDDFVGGAEIDWEAMKPPDIAATRVYR